MANYKLAIFDMDGTILNTIEDLANAVNACLREYNYPERTLEQTKSIVGNGLQMTLTKSLPQNISDEILNNNNYEIDGMSKALFDEMLNFFTIYYKDHSAINTRPYDGINETIIELRKRGIKTAVVSNKRDEAVKKLCIDFYDGLFDFSLGEKDGLNRKPHPDMVNYVLSEMQINKEEAIYIGDSEVDIATAKNSRLDGIAVTWGFRTKEFLKECGASVFADNPDDIIDLICK